MEPLPVLAIALVKALRAELLLAAAAAAALAVAPLPLAADAEEVAPGPDRGGGGRVRGRRCDRPRRRVRYSSPGWRPTGGGHVNVTERTGILRVARVDLHHDVVLIDGAIDDRYLALPKCVVQRIVDLPRGDAKARSGVAVDVEVGFEPPLLLIGAYVR